METTKQKLDKLAQLRLQRDALTAEKQDLIDSVITPEIKERIAEIEAEFSGKGVAVNSVIETLEAEIKAEVREFGASVKGVVLQAVYTKGRYSYSETKKDGYEKAEVWRKQGEPSVTIR